MSGGGKGGSQSSSVEVPQYIEDAARRNLARAEQIGQTGHVQYRGPDVAAFTPMQQSAFQNTNNAASAFGMSTPEGGIEGSLGEPTTYANGMQGYSSAPIYDQAMQNFAENSPGQKAYIDSFFIDPVTGAPRSNGDTNQGNQNSGTQNQWQAPHDNVRDDLMAAENNTHQGSGTIGGYNGFGDMFDGGGAGASGDTFQGGGRISSIANAVASPSGSDGGGGGGDDCVIATHAVSSGAFTANMKREAVSWCMSNLHGKWWGEALRRGYRHTGNKKIAQGKAANHYDEFSRYVDFASGKNRNLRGAITFLTRSVQFVVLGLFKRGA